jgi:hypothetical protein
VTTTAEVHHLLVACRKAGLGLGIIKAKIKQKTRSNTRSYTFRCINDEIFVGSFRKL